MNQEERRIYLIRELQREMPQYQHIEIPAGETEQWQLLRSLFNVRPPYPANADFLRIQDEYLTEMNARGGITDARSLVPTKADSRIYLWQGDITTLRCDAIVNAANSALLGCWYPLHSCIDNMIHSRSGIQLRLCCNALMKAQGHEEPAGQAKITPAYNLPGKYILHTVGPIIRGRVTGKDRELLASCYRSCLALAAENGLKSIAFCCISTGEFHFPNQEAAKIAVKTVQEFLQTDTGIQQVIFNVFKDIDLAIYREILGN